MLGTGVGEIVSRLITGSTSPTDEIILQEFSPYREFKGMEKLK
jgi:hypothetical protein